ncbi:MAG: leucine-rich repeat domain-containing protein [Cyanobacteriota bacterium]|nr:leucine-rich repeat domain-containing protein [Cyanobacteriota bacterium]
MSIQLKNTLLGLGIVFVGIMGCSRPANAEQILQNEDYSTFVQWCENKERISPEARHTVEVLLEKVQTQDCATASERLTNLNALNLDRNQITNISPLSTLTNLVFLWLNDNHITDISPLSPLTNLRYLNIRENQIIDISPLSPLINLTILRLNDNQIVDVSSFSKLTNLTILHLNDNQITDISHLSKLTNLTGITLSGNPLTNPTCPVQPESICEF